jgi:hypothetical protein
VTLDCSLRRCCGSGVVTRLPVHVAVDQGVVQYNRDNRAFEGAQNTNITTDVVVRRRVCVCVRVWCGATHMRVCVRVVCSAT